MNNMDTAPKDGTRILINRKYYSYVNGKWEWEGTQVIECWYDTKDEIWRPFCGNFETMSTDFIDPISWSPVP